MKPSKMSPYDQAFILNYFLKTMVKLKGEANSNLDNTTDYKLRYPRLYGITEKLTPEDLNYLLEYID